MLAEVRPGFVKQAACLVEVVVDAVRPCLAPEEVAASLRSEGSPLGFCEQPVELGVPSSHGDGVAASRVYGLADLGEPDEGLLLRLRTCPQALIEVAPEVGTRRRIAEPPPFSPSVQVVTSGGNSQDLVRWSISWMNQPGSMSPS
jgi:hypothetical protein